MIRCSFSISGAIPISCAGALIGRPHFGHLPISAPHPYTGPSNSRSHRGEPKGPGTQILPDLAQMHCKRANFYRADSAWPVLHGCVAPVPFTSVLLHNHTPLSIPRAGTTSRAQATYRSPGRLSHHPEQLGFQLRIPAVRATILSGCPPTAAPSAIYRPDNRSARRPPPRPPHPRLRRAPPKAPSSSRPATPASSATPPSSRASPAGSATPAAAGSPPSTACSPAPPSPAPPARAERGKVGGRTHEIQRLIGRSLRAVVDMKALGERTVILDCDVLQADGGTRTAAITGASVALALALDKLVAAGTLKTSPLRQMIAATSVGIVDGNVLLDLCLRRRLPRRRRHERRHARRRRPRRNPGHRRKRLLHPRRSSTACSTTPKPASANSSPSSKPPSSPPEPHRHQQYAVCP